MDGMTIETAAGVVARDMIRQYMADFSFRVRRSYPASQQVVAAYVDGLAGAVALTIAGGHGGKDEVVNATIAKLREAIDRDLTHLRAS